MGSRAGFLKSIVVKPLAQGYQHLRPYPHFEKSGWPREPWVDIYLGVISDVQCGGWCTTILNKDGNIFIMGVLDGLTNRPRSGHGHHLRELYFPPGWHATSHAVYWPKTAIKQYSTGRSNVLGLSDTGLVWEWKSDLAALVTPLNVSLDNRRVLEVQAGWDRNALLVKGEGIIYWSTEQDSDLVPGGRQQSLQAGHSVTVNTVTIPGTSYCQSTKRLFTEESLEARIGEIKQFIVLAQHIVFSTKTNRIFSCATTYPLAELSRPDPVELTTFYSTSQSDDGKPFEARSLVGSYHNFAVFTSSGTILTGTNAFLETYHDLITSPVTGDLPPQPDLLPPLQTGDIVSLSFGDHHMHALHSDGTVSSLGTECQSCGSLGLGSPVESRYRGVLEKTGSFWADLHVPANTIERRSVWFEPLMEYWIRKIIHNTHRNNDNEHDVGRILNVPSYREKMGNWFEREGKRWTGLEAGRRELASNSERSTGTLSIASSYGNQYTRKGTDEDDNEDDLPAYFALKVASAGWHSAALVLVDDTKAQSIRDRYIKPPQLSPAPSLTRTFWNLGRRFLGLVDRDTNEQNEVKYVFDEDKLPSL